MHLGATPRSLLALGVLGACYAPNEQTGAPCDLGRDNCPAGQVCTMARDGRTTCQLDHTIDAHGGGEVGGDGSLCFGTGLVHGLCLTTAPTGPVTLSISINTATMGSPNCTSIESQSGGPPLCVVAAESITIDAGRTITAIGANPLVLIATGTLTINGTLDVASHAAASAPGAGSQMTCGAATVNGTNGSGGNGGGGGAGGSFGTTGGNGGKGHNNVNAGVFGPATSPIVLVGGCPGGSGGAGDGGMGAGVGGGGGGAVYLIANSISIGGTLDASGAGGAGGSGGLNSGGGAGGGGAGGFIGLDATTITVSGSVFANGGGGGGGNGDQPDKGGTAGGDPTAPATQASGGTGGGGGGANGGKGYAGGMAPGAGSSVGNCSSSPGCGGGGGGGGAGIVRTYGGTPSGGMISPPPT